ncbi:MAG: DNA-binding response regulator [Acidobacteria bacterium]|nr:MAG: DNA-binding response regulator [Acidobacteriota bacterium]
MRVIHDVGDSNDKPTIAVLLAGEHLLVREGLRKLLEGEPGIVVVGDVADPQEALTVTRAVKPKVVIVAFSGRPLIRTLRSLRQLAPAGDYGRAIVLAARITGKQMTQALQLGVAGILLKEPSARTLVERLRTVAADDHAGRAVDMQSEPTPATIRTSDSTAAPVPHFSLTSRELDIVSAVRRGESNRAIARRLALSEDTVKHHLTSVFDKTGVASRLELALFAMQHGLGEDGVALNTFMNQR